MHILVVSLVRLLRDGLASTLAQRASVRSVAVAGDAQAALLALRCDQPHLILVDVASDEGLQTGRLLAAAARNALVVGFAAEDHLPRKYARAPLGFAGFLLREASIEDLLAAITHAGGGERRTPSASSIVWCQRPALPHADWFPTRPRQLTSREREIVRLIGAGLSNKEIGRELAIELSTVKNHVHNILEKLDISRREEAATRMELMDPGTHQAVWP